MAIRHREGDPVETSSSSAMSPPRKPAAHAQLAEGVAEYVRDLITSGHARPGEFLRIERIAESVGVSHTPVREALLALKSEGLVTLLPRRGFAVTPITPHDVADLFWAQAQLGGELAARAARKITDLQVEQLAMNVAEYRGAVRTNDSAGQSELGREFHKAVNSAADSDRLVTILHTLMTNLPARYHQALSPEQTITDHAELFEAFKKRDVDLARRLMAEHIADQGARLVVMLTESGVMMEPDE